MSGSIINKIGAQYALTRKTTHAVENLSPLSENVVRVVASFNRQPDEAAVNDMVTAAFGGKATVVPGSFRNRGGDFRPTVAGYVSLKPDEKPASETANMREIAANVFMDPEDQTVWTVSGDNIVRAAKENLAEIAATVEVRKTTNGKREEALALVNKFVGPDDTQMIAYVDAETAKVIVGVRVSDDHVFSEEAGLQEIAQDQVVDVENLQGADKVDSIAVASIGDTNAMIDFYRKLYSFDPAYFAMVEKIIRERALV